MAPTEPGGAGRQQRLSRDAILDRALAVADTEGLDAVSVRRLARELGVTPMALYWHFEGKEALLHALGDRLLSGLDLAVDQRAGWPEQLRALVVSLTAQPYAYVAASLPRAVRVSSSTLARSFATARTVNQHASATSTTGSSRAMPVNPAAAPSGEANAAHPVAAGVGSPTR